jgi:hypothetical protein
MREQRMTNGVVPADVKAFLLRHIDSIAQLEALLLLRREAERSWSAETLATRLYVSPELTADILARLEAGGFVVDEAGAPTTYRYTCASAEQARMVDEVAKLYATCLIPVTHIVHSKARTRAQEFADAFKLRKDR